MATLSQPASGVGSTAGKEPQLGTTEYTNYLVDQGNKLGMNLDRFRLVSNVVDADAVENSKGPVSTSNPPPSTLADGITGKSSAFADIIKNEDAKALEAQTTEKSITDKITESMNKILGIGETEAKLKEDAGINQLKEVKRNAVNKMAISQQAQMNELKSLEKQMGGTTEGKAEAQAAINRKYALEQGQYQLDYHLANSDYTAAMDTINETIKLQLEPETKRLEFLQFFYTNNQNKLSKAEDRAFQAKTAQVEKEIAAKEKNLEQIYNIQLELAKLGKSVPNSLMTKYKSGDLPATDLLNDLTASGISLEKPTTSGSGSNTQTDNERALMSQFRGEQIVKDYNDILGQKGTIDAYIQNGVGGPADLALVFSFMKGLDPTSVVRESEYQTAAKSGNIFQGAFAKFNGYFKENGGFLPDNVKKEFQNLVNQKLAVKQKQYENVKSQYEGIAKRQGLNSENVVIDYASGGTTAEDIPQNKDEAIFNSVVPEAKSSSWVVNLWNKIF